MRCESCKCKLREGERVIPVYSFVEAHRGNFVSNSDPKYVHLTCVTLRENF